MCASLKIRTNNERLAFWFISNHVFIFLLGLDYIGTQIVRYVCLGIVQCSSSTLIIIRQMVSFISKKCSYIKQIPSPFHNKMFLILFVHSQCVGDNCIITAYIIEYNITYFEIIQCINMNI